MQEPTVDLVDADAIQPAIVVTDSTDDYESLAEAVAAQTTETDTRELECLAAGVYHESKGEPLAGQLAVANVILNRVKAGRFGNSACAVLRQPGQFSFVRGGIVPIAEGKRGWSTAVAIAKIASGDLWAAAAPKALYFHARRVSPNWRTTKVAAIGNHVFYR